MQENYVREFCRVYNVPSQLFGDSTTSTYNNINEMRKAIYTDAVIPAVNDMLLYLNKYFVESYDINYELYIDYSDIESLQSDYVERANWVNSIKETLSINEIREKFGFDRIANAKYDIPLIDYNNSDSVDLKSINLKDILLNK